MGLKELDILARIRARMPGGSELSDDCGALPSPAPGETLLVTTDTLEEGTHFRRDWHPPRMLGRKLVRANLSDLDASGARPLGCTLSLALPPELEPAWLDELLEGIAQACEQAAIPVVGGDTVGRPQGIGLSLTAFGATRRWLRRDGLRVGDRIYVDQPLGASLRGLGKLQRSATPDLTDPDVLAHLDPSPNLGLGLKLAGLPEVHACMDLSDGLSRDLRNLAEASRLSIRITATLSPEALQGGEDFARCFGASLDREALEARLGHPLQEIGIVLPRGSEPVVLYDGISDHPLPDLGFDHFAP
ncbi:MAG TPA: thiamine-phosphate kinase [Holophagaceae bacterium]|nr:thiamine-phosphate kinase [Holophagaceae bacterium]